MPKTLKVISIVLFFISLLPIAFSQAQTTDSIRFVTYYPSPYGSYAELRTKRMAIGDSPVPGDSYVQYKDYCWPEDNGTYTCSHPIYSDLNSNGYYDLGEQNAVDLVVQGNVGIGTTNPYRQLQVNSSTGQGHIIITGVSDGSTYSGLYLNDMNSDPEVNSWGITHVETMPGFLENTLAFARWSNHASTTPMVIVPSGNVGIGTTDPGANRLKVVGGPIQATDGLIIETRGTNPPGVADTGRMWLCTDSAPYCDGG